MGEQEQTVPESVAYRCGSCSSVCNGRDRQGLCSNCGSRLEYEQSLNFNRARCRYRKCDGGDGVPCPNKENGCNFKLTGCDDYEHLRSCLFRMPPICKLFGFTNCSFTSSQPSQILKHLNEFHKVNKYVAPSKGVITFKDFSSFTDQPYDRAGCTLWEVHTPEEKDIVRFLIYRAINTIKSDYIFVCFYMGECAEKADEYLVEISIRDSLKKTTKWKWTGEPTHFTTAEEHLRNPPFRIPLKYLRKHHIGGDDVTDLAWEISLIKSPTGGRKSLD